MKRLFWLASLLYPSWWRQRYGREFEALIEDANPGVRDLFDVVKGALTMQFRTYATLPLACALAGAMIGGLIALRTPAMFVSSGTVRLQDAELGAANSAAAEELRMAVEKAVRAAGGSPTAITVALRGSGASSGTAVQLAYRDGDPVQAQRMAEQLTSALVTAKGSAAATVLEGPTRPDSPVAPNYSLNIGSGAGVGLAFGGLLALGIYPRRR